MQVFRDVSLVVSSAMGVVVGEVVNVDAVFENRVHLAIGLAITGLVLVAVIHFPADRICFPPQSIGQRIYMASGAKRVLSSTVSMIGLSKNVAALLNTKNGDDGDGE